MNCSCSTCRLTGASSQEDLVLTRILWFDGKESHNANTLERYIYLHGTNQESFLGAPASHGSIRVSNKDILELFDLLQAGDEVEDV
jgi:L,D-transpeptidase YbiS